MAAVRRGVTVASSIIRPSIAGHATHGFRCPPDRALTRRLATPAIRGGTSEAKGNSRGLRSGRYQVRSLILTSELPVTRWHEQIGAILTVADGILDRLVHNAHSIEKRGHSMRKKSRQAEHIAIALGRRGCLADWRRVPRKSQLSGAGRLVNAARPGRIYPVEASAAYLPERGLHGPNVRVSHCHLSFQGE